ncbi:hypothetical protein MGWOODY_XGa324 [hydrothermal vent metagenome]|uniref:Uncharacterized protein n=1 Tax=hydrothermal vent metagenome TaxID=652676 RepID=A0A160TTM8_9ZZZZ
MGKSNPASSPDFRTLSIQLFLCTFADGIDRKAHERVFSIELEKPIY